MALRPRRRLDLRKRFFTSGGAASLDDVASGASWTGDRFFHGGPRGEARLGPDESRALVTFLSLL